MGGKLEITNMVRRPTVLRELRTHLFQRTAARLRSGSSQQISLLYREHKFLSFDELVYDKEEVDVLRTPTSLIHCKLFPLIYQWEIPSIPPSSALTYFAALPKTSG